MSDSYTIDRYKDCENFQRSEARNPEFSINLILCRPCENVPSYHISKMMIFTAFPTTIELSCPVRAAGGKKMGNNLLGRTVAQSKGNSLHQLQQMAPSIYVLVRAQQEWNRLQAIWWAVKSLCECWVDMLHDVRSRSELSIYASPGVFQLQTNNSRQHVRFLELPGQTIVSFLHVKTDVSRAGEEVYFPFQC